THVMKFERCFSTSGTPVASQIDWKLVDSKITDVKGNVIFAMSGVEVPEHWSQTAIDILAQKYLRKAGVPSHTVTRFSINSDRENEYRPCGMPTWLWPSSPAQ